MKDVPKELQEKVRKYFLMVAWWHIYEEEKGMEDKLVKVLKKIEQTEDELRVSGIKNEVFDEVMEKVKNFVNMKTGEMTDAQLLTACKLIFGQQMEYA
jgi:hypothetical protein